MSRGMAGADRPMNDGDDDDAMRDDDEGVGRGIEDDW